MTRNVFKSLQELNSLRLQDWWSSCGLVNQIAMVASIVLICGMAVIGSWVSKKIENTITHNTGASIALQMDNFISPLLQELADVDRLSKSNQIGVNKILTSSEMQKKIASTLVWKQGGVIVYSSLKSNIGKVFPISSNLKSALKGSIAVEFVTTVERKSGLPILEIYSPIREKLTGRIIAVVEYYARSESYKDALFRAQLGAWVVVGIVTLAIIVLLSGIVRKGSQIIVNQSISQQERVEQLSFLRDQIERSSRNSTELNERFLRQIGSDLHDGPAQLISLALLRLDSLMVSTNNESTDDVEVADNFNLVHGALKDALEEIRNLSAGLILPEFKSHTLEQGLQKVIDIHEKRTQIAINRDISDLPKKVHKSIKISLYRMVQEGLNNAFHYARDAKVIVRAHYTGSAIEVQVSDNGHGFDNTISYESNSGLGLPGLRERIESIGGSFDVNSSNEEGTRLSARFIVGEVG